MCAEQDCECMTVLDQSGSAYVERGADGDESARAHVANVASLNLADVRRGYLGSAGQLPRREARSKSLRFQPCAQDRLTVAHR